MAVAPAFELTPANASIVAEICQRLDGIPLAIELAAARVPVLSVGEILQRLGDRFRLLTGGRRTAVPRQQTLQALIDWSWDLLPRGRSPSAPAPVRVLRRLDAGGGGGGLRRRTTDGATDGEPDTLAGARCADLAGRALARRGRARQLDALPPSGDDPPIRSRPSRRERRDRCHPGPTPGLLPRLQPTGRARDARAGVRRLVAAPRRRRRQPAAGHRLGARVRPRGRDPDVRRALVAVAHPLGRRARGLVRPGGRGRTRAAAAPGRGPTRAGHPRRSSLLGGGLHAGDMDEPRCPCAGR